MITHSHSHNDKSITRWLHHHHACRVRQLDLQLLSLSGRLAIRPNKSTTESISDSDPSHWLVQWMTEWHGDSQSHWLSQSVSHCRDLSVSLSESVAESETDKSRQWHDLPSLSESENEFSHGSAVTFWLRTGTVSRPFCSWMASSNVVIHLLGQFHCERRDFLCRCHAC